MNVAPGIDHRRRSTPIEKLMERLYRRITTIDPLAQHRIMGATIGLALLVPLVPLLNVFGGTAGQLGQSIPLFFLVPVLLAATLGGRRAGVLVSIAAIAAWDWYFIPPLYHVSIAAARDLVALVVFMGVALLTGHLATSVRKRTAEALRRAHSSEALYNLSMTLIAGRDVAGALPALTQRLRDTFDLEACAILLPSDSTAQWRTAAQAGEIDRSLAIEFSKNVAAVATWVSEHGQTSRLGQVTNDAKGNARSFRPRAGQERARFLPLRVGSHPVGVLELVNKAGMKPDPDRERLLATFANGAAIALEQERLALEEQAAEIARASDQLKSTLLSSVSHDLRTPLAGIKAAASSLLQTDVYWSEQDRHAFIKDIDAEADRLTRLVSNLLDLSRIEAGALKPLMEWEDVGDLLERVVRRMESRLLTHRMERAWPDNLPAVRMDALQIEQAVTNLIENAVKYSPPEAPMTVSAEATVLPATQSPGVAISVRDRGPGIPASEQPRIFDTFYRITTTAQRTGGSGVGLAIVKGLVEAHGGTVSVISKVGQGSTFTIALPINQTVTPSKQQASLHLQHSERARQ